MGEMKMDEQVADILRRGGVLSLSPDLFDEIPTSTVSHALVVALGGIETRRNPFLPARTLAAALGDEIVIVKVSR